MVVVIYTFPLKMYSFTVVTVTVDDILAQTVSSIVHFCKECVAQ